MSVKADRRQLYKRGLQIELIMIYNYNKLRLRINEVCGDVVKFAERLKCDKRTVADKLSEERDFSQSDIELICQILDIPRSEIYDYFFDAIG